MIVDTLKKRKQVRIFDTEKAPDIELIRTIITKAFEVSASKQNFYPYNVFVLHKAEDRKTFWEITKSAPGGEGNYNVETAPYHLIFTRRTPTTHPDPIMKKRIAKGLVYPIMNKDSKEDHRVSIEVGMFAKVLTTIALENNVDVSYQLCFPDWVGEAHKWEKFPFIQENVLLCMQLGYDSKKMDNEREKKPTIEKVIKWI
jgi:hypothetical protein